MKKVLLIGLLMVLSAVGGAWVVRHLECGMPAEVKAEAVKVAKVAEEPAAKEEPPKPVIATEGAELGVWTMDFEAAKAVAASANKPLLLNFTGSDWCGWCKLMDRRVFSQEAWAAYAKEHLALVWVDFPRDKSRVPETFVARNQALATRYSVRGYPTYVLIAPDGTEIGRLGASQEATPESFSAQIQSLITLTRIEELLSPEDLNAYHALQAEQEALEAEQAAWLTKVRQEGSTFEGRQDALHQQLEALRAKAAENALQ